MRRFHSASLAALAALAALALAMAAQAASAPDAREIRLRAGAFDPLTPGRPSSHLPDRAAYPSGALGAYLVQFEQPIDDAMRSAVEALGVKLGGSVPVQALEALMTEAQRAQVSELPGVRWVGPYQASWKLSPGVLACSGGAPTATTRYPESSSRSTTSSRTPSSSSTTRTVSPRAATGRAAWAGGAPAPSGSAAAAGRYTVTVVPRPGTL